MKHACILASRDDRLALIHRRLPSFLPVLFLTCAQKAWCSLPCMAQLQPLVINDGKWTRTRCPRLIEKGPLRQTKLKQTTCVSLRFGRRLYPSQCGVHSFRVSCACAYNTRYSRSSTAGYVPPLDPSSVLQHNLHPSKSKPSAKSRTFTFDIRISPARTPSSLLEVVGIAAPVASCSKRTSRPPQWYIASIPSTTRRVKQIQLWARVQGQIKARMGHSWDSVRLTLSFV